MLLALAVLVAVAVLAGTAAFKPESEVGRWAAVSTMWILLPLIGTGTLLLIVLIALIYGLARLLGILPTYTLQAQNFIWRVGAAIKHYADEAAKPILAIEGIRGAIKRLTGKK